uniref:Putative conserved secreted protein n=1 Tax=Culex tarsalis TaxID=7177 RepID=A0A1Q3G030_CULTA
MNSFFLCLYLIYCIGYLISLSYYIKDVLQYRRLGNLIISRREAVQPEAPTERRQPIRKYVSSHRHKMLRRRWINVVNRINGKLRIKPLRERYELYFDSDGEIGLRTITT